MRTLTLTICLSLASCFPADSAPPCPVQPADLAQAADLAQPVPEWARLPCGDETDCPKEPEALFCASDRPAELCAHPAKCGFCRRPL